MAILLVLFCVGCFFMTPEEKQKISDAGQWGVPPPGKSHPFYRIEKPSR